MSLAFSFQDERHIYFGLPYCPKGDLFTYATQANRLSPQLIRFYAAEIVLALEHLHSMGIIYRDLKLENILLDCDGHLLLTDFGFSFREDLSILLFFTIIDVEGQEDRAMVGTPIYMAPEVFQRKTTPMVDWWALGCVLYVMLKGRPLFIEKEILKLIQLISTVRWLLFLHSFFC